MINIYPVALVIVITEISIAGHVKSCLCGVVEERPDSIPMIVFVAFEPKRHCESVCYFFVIQRIDKLSVAAITVSSEELMMVIAQSHAVLLCHWQLCSSVLLQLCLLFRIIGIYHVDRVEVIISRYAFR